MILLNQQQKKIKNKDNEDTPNLFTEKKNILQKKKKKQEK